MAIVGLNDIAQAHPVIIIYFGIQLLSDNSFGDLYVDKTVHLVQQSNSYRPFLKVAVTLLRLTSN